MPVTANSFVLVNSDPIKVAQLDAALHYLQTNSPDMARPMLEQAAENQVRIVFSDPVVNKEDGYGESSHSIVWDPSSGLVVLDRPNGTPIGVESAANGLIHEIAHSLEIAQAARHDPDTNGNAQYGNNSEATATMYANAVAKDCGEPERPDYASAKEIRVSNPTEHTERGPNSSQVWSQNNALGREETGPRYEPNVPAPTFGSNAGNGGGNEHDYDPGNSPGNEHDYDPGNYPGNEHDNDPGEWTGGSGGGGGCVAITSLLPDGTRAGDIVVGDMMQLADAVTLEKGSGEVTFSKLKQAPGFRITTEKGVSLVCSDTAPIPTRHGLLVPAQLLGEEVPVRWDEAGAEHVGWERITKVESVGVIYVQHITVGDRCFWAGEKPGAYILHHNDKDDSGDDGEGGFYDPLTAGHGNNSATAGSNSHSTAGAAGAGQNLVFASNQATGNDLQFPITQSAPQPSADHAVVTHDAAVIVGVAPPVIDPIMLM